MDTHRVDVHAQCVPATERGDAAVAAAEAHWREPAIELCERARRSMCVYVDLASRLVATAWELYECPAGVRQMVIAAAPWEAWVTWFVVCHDDSHMELLLLRYASCMSGLRELYAGRLSVPGPFASVSTCVEVLQRCPQLTRIDVSRRAINETTMSELCVGFTGLSRLRALRMSNNPLRAGGARWLAEALTHTLALTSLDVSETQLDEAAMAALEPGFAHLSQLQKLQMSYNPLGADGAAALARALSHTPALQKLGLESTSLDAAAMSALEPALFHLNHMQILNVRDNPFGPAGAACLARALRHMLSLRFLWVQSTGIDEADKTAIRAALPRECRVMFDSGWETIA